jgi:hypothetical protein
MPSLARLRTLIVVIVLVTAALVAFMVYRNRSLSVQYVTVNYLHSHGVAVYDVSETQNAKTNKSVLAASLSRSGEKLKLSRGRSYMVSAQGDTGYENKTAGFVLGNNQQTIKINPYYSTAKLDSLVNSELGAINAALASKYPQINLYQIQTGKLYHWADWYGTILVYKGSYGLNADALRVILAKENDVWVVKTDPPDITLSKYVYPEVSVDILRSVNNDPRFKAVLPPVNRGTGAHLR